MPKFAANLTMLFTDRPFLERFDAAARNGFRAVEYMFPYQEDTDGIARALDRLKLEQVLFNLPAGDWAAGDRGVAAHPRPRGGFRRGAGQAGGPAPRPPGRGGKLPVGETDETPGPEEGWRGLAGEPRRVSPAGGPPT